MKAAAIIPASGAGTRFGGETPKQFATLAGKEVLEYSLSAFERASNISAIVLLVAEEHKVEVERRFAPRFRKILSVVCGGRRRQDSVYNGLCAAPDEFDVVVVHDAARPLIRPALIDRCAELANEFGACIVARPVPDTVKRVGAADTITDTVDRTGLWLAQTPQAARRDLLVRAFEDANAKGVTVTDEAMLIERIGGCVKALAGDPWNIKITTPEDLAFADKIVRSGLI